MICCVLSFGGQVPARLLFVGESQVRLIRILVVCATVCPWFLLETCRSAKEQTQLLISDDLKGLFPPPSLPHLCLFLLPHFRTIVNFGAEKQFEFSIKLHIWAALSMQSSLWLCPQGATGMSQAELFV